MNKYNSIISNFSRQKILVIGDLILDKYIQGNVTRLSPEAPVPVVLEEKSFFTPGGAANVANNLNALKAKVCLVGRIGDDEEGKVLLKELKKKGIEAAGIYVDARLPTICKTRVIAQHQQVVRIDREKIEGEGGSSSKEKTFEYIKTQIPHVDAIILSDYGKGLITAELVHFVCSLALSHKKIIAVDPKVEHFSFYRKVTAITPNLKETENAIKNIKITAHDPHALKVNFDALKTDQEINAAGNGLLKYLDLESLLITLGEHGMRLFEKGKAVVAIKTKAKEVFDVTGAGDTVISLFALSLAAGATKRQAADLSNFAAGIVVGKMGAATATQEELRKAIEES